MINMEKKIKYLFELKGDYETNVKEFMKIEGFLDFCYRNNFRNNIKDLSNLLFNLHKIGKSDLSEVHYNLDKLRDIYYELSSKSYYEKLIDIYNTKEIDCRIYSIENNKIIKNKEVSFNIDERKVYYSSLFNNKKKTMNYIKYNNNISKYKFRLKNLDIEVDFGELDLELIDFPKEKSKKGGTFSCTINELTEAAREIDTIIENKIKEGETSIRRENFEERIKKSIIKAFKKKKIINTKKIKVNKVCNILGMVGAGKSTFMVVLSYLAAKNGYRICIVLESTKEVFDLNNLLNIIGINSTAIKGRSTILDQMDKVTEDEYMYMDSKYSKELSGACVLDGIVNRLDNIITIDYGKEPCYSLTNEKNNEKYLCPAYGICPRKESERKIAQADVIVTNIYSLIYARTHYNSKYKRNALIEYIVDNLDIVIFDEADKTQVTLDKIFCETESIKELLKNNKNGVSEMTEKLIDGDGNKDFIKITKEFYKIIYQLGQIRDSINNNIINEIPRIKNGKWFSALLLLKEFSEERNKCVINEIRNYMLKDSESKLINRYVLNEDKRDLLREEIKVDYKFTKEEIVKLEFIIDLALFEKSIIKFGSMIQEISSNENIDFDIPNIFRSPFRSIRKLIPTSPVGNRFGYIYKKEEKDVSIFRQYGVGRSLMIDLPNIKIDKDGNSLGPDVILLSGSSWAEGSLRYHVNKQVSYVLQSNDEIVRFVEQTKCIKIPSSTRVSGSFNKIKAIENLIEEAKKYLDNELNASGNLLVVVNSYEQCIAAQSKLASIYPNIDIYRLISDKDKEGINTIKKGELRNVYKKNIRILIVPAMAIERGHNIVDEFGHSIFNSLFFLVRPMEVPREIENIISTINGAIVDISIKGYRKKIPNNNRDIINGAYKLWDILFRNYYSVANTEDIIKKDIIVSRLVLIMQVFGRLLRIVDCKKPIPKIYFADASFSGGELNNFDLLEEIIYYLKENIDRKDVGKLVDLLYGPFYRALKGGYINV